MGTAEATAVELLAPLARSAAVLHAPPEFLEKLPIAVYACDGGGGLLWSNRRAAELWGRKLRVGEDCGRDAMGEETPLATVLRTAVATRGVEARVELPDGSGIPGLLYIEPVQDQGGDVIGAIACFCETSGLPRASEDIDMLHRQEQRLAATFEHAGIGIAEVDAEGKLRRVNEHLAALLGYSSGELLGRSIFDPALAEDLETDQAQFRRQVKGEIDVYTVEKGFRRSDGTKLWISVTSSAIRGRESQFLYAVRVQHDITEKKRAERAAQELAAIVESSDDAIVSKDLDGIIATWNRGAEHLFGYKAEEVIGRPITILIPPDRLGEEPEILSQIRRGEHVDHFETVRLRKDGSLIDISLTVSPVRDPQGRIVGASKIARDITERKQAEARLRESECRLQDLLAAIPAAIYTTDAHGRITYYNQAAVELAGREPALGSDEWCVSWKLYRPDGTLLPHAESPMAIALKEGHPIRNAEAIAERPDGTRVPFIPYPTPLRDASGNVVGAINMLADISERKLAETQQRILFNELNHRVKNNMQMLQSLLHIAGKQTRNPEAQQILGEATSRIAAMAAAQQVLYGTTDATRFNAREFLSSVCHTVQQTFAREVDIICEAGEAELSNDAAMPLALILNELLTNAMKHGADGSGKTAIRVGLTRQEKSFLLYVEDGGPGFDLNAVRPRSSGLQLVQGLVRQLGGKFEVARNPHTRCSVEFP